MSRTRLPSLTPLRGIAALVVLLHHLAGYFLPGTGQVIAEHSQFLVNGYLCVDFFFILSGFLLAHLYRDKLYGSARVRAYGAFIRARFARIYPLHLATLLAILGLNLARVTAEIRTTGLDAYLTSDNFLGLRFSGHDTLASFAKNLFLLQSLQVGAYSSWNGPAWSVGAEWIAYLAFPLLLIPSSRMPQLNRFLCVPLVLLGLWLIETQISGTLDLAGYAGVARCLMECWLGITFYTFFKSGIGRSVLSRDSTLLAAMGVCFWVMHQDLSDTLVILPFALVILCACQNKGAINWILNGKSLTLLGEISYSVYMTHWFILSSVFWLWQGAFGTELGTGMGFLASCGVLILSIIAVLLLSWCTYRFIEVPWRTRLRGQG